MGRWVAILFTCWFETSFTLWILLDIITHRGIDGNLQSALDLSFLSDIILYLMHTHCACSSLHSHVVYLFPGQITPIYSWLLTLLLRDW